MVLFFGLLSSVLLSGINKDIAFYALMNKILPPWLVGISFASILAVVMSSVDSFVVGGSTIIFRTIFKKDHYESKKDLFFARLITAGFGILGSLIAFIVPNIVTLSLFVGYLILIFIPSIFAGLYSKRVSANASFLSILIPFILLVIFFPIIGKNTFLITTILSILIVLFYDKLFKSHPTTHQ